jgi:5'-nucleotidase
MTQPTKRPSALVTNDDGIQSHFMWTLVKALAEHFDVTVVAPDGERSWTGRGFTRNGTLTLTPQTQARTFALDGTPTDCVNIGIAHLMEVPPDVVVSGINLGFNMSLPLISTSGTVAGALEGALWGIHGVAASFHIPFDVFETVKASHGLMEGPLQAALVESAKRTAEYAISLVQTPATQTVVHNLNFPSKMTPDTELESVSLSNLRLGGLYKKTAENQFEFKFPEKREPVYIAETTDFMALKREHASVCLINYDHLTPRS